MGLLSTDRVRRRALPVASSIHWKPLRDPHYVVASLEPNHGRRQLFVTQTALMRVQSLAISRNVGTLGLLLGRRYECPVTGASYLQIERLAESAEPPDQTTVALDLSNLISSFRGADGLEIVGWYCSAPHFEPRPTVALTELHRATFPHPWQTMLIVGQRGDGGAFFLRDHSAHRWFQSPFYEETTPPRGSIGKMTCIAWENCLTTDTVLPLAIPRLDEREPRTVAAALATSAETAMPEPARIVALARKRASVAEHRLTPERTGPTASERVWQALRGGATSVARRLRSVTLAAIANLRSASSRIVHQAGTASTSVLKRTQQASSHLGEQIAHQATHARDAAVSSGRSLAARAAEARARRAESAKAARETSFARVATAMAPKPQPLEKAASIPRPAEPAPWPRDVTLGRPTLVRPPQRPTPAAEATSTQTPIADLEDTTSWDPPFRYLALATREGFVLVTKSESSSGQPEHWVLEEPESGFLLTVTTSDRSVRESTLHYNLHTDDELVLRRARLEHVDLESRTVYVREPAIDSLRSRCRRLRASGALVRQWKVSPPIPTTATQHGQTVLVSRD